MSGSRATITWVVSGAIGVATFTTGMILSQRGGEATPMESRPAVRVNPGSAAATPTATVSPTDKQTTTATVSPTRKPTATKTTPPVTAPTAPTAPSAVTPPSAETAD